MKIKWTFISVIMATLLLLVACGTTDSDNESTETDKDQKTVDEIEVVEEEESKSENSSADKADTTDTPSEDTETVTPETEENKVDSDNQDYSVNLLANYELTGEEPGRDMIYSNDDDRYFMRIETVENEDGTYDTLKDNMLALLDASSNGETPVELTDKASLPAGDALSNIQAYRVDTETGPVTGIIFERGDLIIRLTIFDSVNEDYFADFLEMGESISRK